MMGLENRFQVDKLGYSRKGRSTISHEEELEKKVIKYSAQNSKYYQRIKKEKNDIEAEQYEFTHTRKGVEHKIKLYRLN